MNIFYRCIICACLKIKSFFLHSTLACRSALRRKHKEEMSMNASRPHHLPVLQKEHEQEMHVNYSILFIYFYIMFLDVCCCFMLSIDLKNLNFIFKSFFKS